MLARARRYYIYSRRQRLTSCSKKQGLAVRLLHLCYRRLKQNEPGVVGLWGRC